MTYLPIKPRDIYHYAIPIALVIGASGWITRVPNAGGSAAIAALVVCLLVASHALQSATQWIYRNAKDDKQTYEYLAAAHVLLMLAFFAGAIPWIFSDAPIWSLGYVLFAILNAIDAGKCDVRADACPGESVDADQQTA